MASRSTESSRLGVASKEIEPSLRMMGLPPEAPPSPEKAAPTGRPGPADRSSFDASGGRKVRLKSAWEPLREAVRAMSLKVAVPTVA